MEKVFDLLDSLNEQLQHIAQFCGISGTAFGRRGPGATALLAFGLGVVFTLGILGLGKPCMRFGLHWDFYFYVVGLSFFHFSEYVLTAKFNYSLLSNDSFLLNHSHEFTVATASSFIEFFIEFFFWKGQYHRKFLIIRLAGAVLAIGGEFARKLAMWTAQHNFTHTVQDKKRDAHTLVTNGIYAFSRHPSYFGWFYWTVGLQMVLLNPVCAIGFTLVSWRFFSERIEDEEKKLCKFFPDYPDYRKRVPSRIPFIP